MTMAINKYIEDKWRKGFRFYDSNKDGYLTRDDFLKLATYIADTTKATMEERAKMREDWSKWGATLVPDSKGKTSEEDWMLICIDLYKDLENFRRINTETYSMLFDNLDMNKDDLISMEELQIFYEAHGFHDANFVRRVFEQLDTNRDGYVDREEFIKAGVNHWTSADENDGYAFMYDPVEETAKRD